MLWFALAPVIGSGSRRLSRLRATAISTAAIGSALMLSTALARAVARPRPCDRGAHSLVPCPEGGSCPSDQAAAAFAAAEILGWFEPRLRTPLLATGTAIAIARVAAGVHYPSDVFTGGALGVALSRAARTAAQASRTRCAQLGP